MNSERHGRMLSLVREHHARQSRNGGRVPYAQHCERVSRLLAYVLDKTGEASPAERETITLAGLGHDLIEDTSVDHGTLVEHFGSQVADLIAEVTNADGDARMDGYIAKLQTASDAAMLVKLADLSENATNASYAVHENGPKPTADWSGLMRPQFEVLRARTCKSMPESARMLQQFAEIALEEMRLAAASASSGTPSKSFRLTPSEIESLRQNSRQQSREAEAFLASEEGRKLFGEPDS